MRRNGRKDFVSVFYLQAKRLAFINKQRKLPGIDVNVNVMKPYQRNKKYFYEVNKGVFLYASYLIHNIL